MIWLINRNIISCVKLLFDTDKYSRLNYKTTVNTRRAGYSILFSFQKSASMVLVFNQGFCFSLEDCVLAAQIFTDPHNNVCVILAHHEGKLDVYCSDRTLIQILKGLNNHSFIDH